MVTGMPASQKPVRIRVRFGESVSEAMCEIDGKNGATNDHAVRDFQLSLPWLGVAEVGNSGFRFVRIDLPDDSVELQLKEIRAIATYRDIPYKGSFRCSDERLNQIWQTGAYTVHLNLQEYLWDGIKRDRLVWIGDMHPEVMILDEPAAALDPAHTRKVHQIVDRLTGKGITVLMATHDIDYAYRWADEIVLMHEGRVLRQGTPREVCGDAEAMEQANLEQPAVMRLYRGLVQKGVIDPAGEPPKTIEDLERRISG